MSRQSPGDVKNIGNYLTKVTLCGPLRLHIFWRGDGDPDCHDHPGDFWTFPLVPYVEEFWTHGVLCQRVVRAFRLHRRRAEFAHRVIGAYLATDLEGNYYTDSKPIVTLLWWGKARRKWGFITAKGWVPWGQYPEKPENEQ